MGIVLSRVLLTVTSYGSTTLSLSVTGGLRCSGCEASTHFLSSFSSCLWSGCSLHLQPTVLLPCPPSVALLCVNCEWDVPGEPIIPQVALMASVSRTPVLIYECCLSGTSLRGTNTHRPRLHRRTLLIDKCTPPHPNSTPPNLPSSSQTSHTANPTPQQTQTARSSPDRASASLSTVSRRLQGTTHRSPRGSLRDSSLRVRHMFREG